MITNKDRAIQMAKAALGTLEGYISNGLPSVYPVFKDCLADWYPDLPWDEAGSICAFEFLASDSEAARIADLILEKFSYDIMPEWRAAAIGQIIEE